MAPRSHSPYMLPPIKYTYANSHANPSAKMKTEENTRNNTTKPTEAIIGQKHEGQVKKHSQGTTNQKTIRDTKSSGIASSKLDKNSQQDSLAKTTVNGEPMDDNTENTSTEVDQERRSEGNNPEQAGADIKTHKDSKADDVISIKPITITPEDTQTNTTVKEEPMDGIIENTDVEMSDAHQDEGDKPEQASADTETHKGNAGSSSNNNNSLTATTMPEPPLTQPTTIFPIRPTSMPPTTHVTMPTSHRAHTEPPAPAHATPLYTPNISALRPVLADIVTRYNDPAAAFFPTEYPYVQLALSHLHGHPPSENDLIAARHLHGVFRNRNTSVWAMAPLKDWAKEAAKGGAGMPEVVKTLTDEQAEADMRLAVQKVAMYSAVEPELMESLGREFGIRVRRIKSVRWEDEEEEGEREKQQLEPERQGRQRELQGGAGAEEAVHAEVFGESQMAQKRPLGEGEWQGGDTARPPAKKVRADADTDAVSLTTQSTEPAHSGGGGGGGGDANANANANAHAHAHETTTLVANGGADGAAGRER